MWLDKSKLPLTNIDLPNSFFEFTLATFRKGGTMIYIHKNTKAQQAKGRFKY